ncbi:hypothetical protein [Streptomyces sp. WAC05858]|uniref:hypothetical protein n=1 Tax=Streptomyces TaxID=1883 RepID=UPI0026D1AC99
MLEAGGAATPEGAAALAELDADLRELGIAPRGSAALLAGGLFLDGLAMGLPAPAVAVVAWCRSVGAARPGGLCRACHLASPVRMAAAHDRPACPHGWARRRWDMTGGGPGRREGR